MIVTLLIFHSIIAVLLLGALLHQSIAVAWPSSKKGAGFVTRFRGVSPGAYTNGIVALYLGVVVLGAFLYPPYRTEVRLVLESMGIRAPTGLFEIKEHFAALGLGVLPAYWYFWREPVSEFKRARVVLTFFLTASVLFNFVIGHVLNNIRGFGM